MVLDVESLSELDFSGTKKIGDYAFSRSGITKANFAMLNEIGNKAFLKCSSLTSICYHGSKTEWDTISKDASCPASAVIHYKADTEEAKDPTCTENGWKETGVCDVCGQDYSDKNNEDNILPALEAQLF